MIQYRTAGESHGPALIAILEGIPSGLTITPESINAELGRRQEGYGRGDRMRIETDSAEILSGVYGGSSIGSPICLLIKNSDATLNEKPDVFTPRPGHADLAGSLKYNLQNMRFVLERSSARETASRVAAGAVCKELLKTVSITVSSRVLIVGGAEQDAIKDRINEAKTTKDSLGGVFEVVASNVPPGLGSYVQYNERLDASLAAALMSIQAIKGVEIGLGFGYASRPGSDVHDQIFYDSEKGYHRSTNNAGGIEGGMSNGEDIVLRAVMKPIPTLGKPLKTVDVKTKKPADALKERSDVCAVQAASVVAEAVVAYELSRAFMNKFGGDCLEDMKNNYENYLERIKRM